MTMRDGIEGEGEHGKKYVTKAELARQKKEWDENCKVMREGAKNKSQ